MEKEVDKDRAREGRTAPPPSADTARIESLVDMSAALVARQGKAAAFAQFRTRNSEWWSGDALAPQQPAAAAAQPRGSGVVANLGAGGNEMIANIAGQWLPNQLVSGEIQGSQWNQLFTQPLLRLKANCHAYAETTVMIP